MDINGPSQTESQSVRWMKRIKSMYADRWRSQTRVVKPELNKTCGLLEARYNSFHGLCAELCYALSDADKSCLSSVFTYIGPLLSVLPVRAGVYSIKPSLHVLSNHIWTRLEGGVNSRPS